MKEVVKLVVGYDPREAIAYHVFCQSVLAKTSLPVQFTPLLLKTLKDYKEHHKDGSNLFTYTRFLAPFLADYQGWVLYADGDMVCMEDIAELWRLRDPTKAVQVVKHDYVSKATKKYLGNQNQNYPRKNWSSLILWNCEHPRNKILTPTYIESSTGAYLHRFQWLADDLIGELPKTWNWLATEYESIRDAKLIHYTLGTPCFRDYQDTEMAEYWHDICRETTRGLET